MRERKPEKNLIGWQVYPNPTTAEIRLFNEQDDWIDELTIFDLLGNRILYKSDLNSLDGTSLDVSFLPNGSYLIIINSESGQSIQNFIKLD